MAQKTATYNSPKGDIEYFRLENKSGASVILSNLGAGIVEVNVPDRNGKMENVSLAYKSPESYFGDGPCMGKTPGRYANRIAKGHLEIDGKTYDLEINNGPNHLHGGTEGFANKLWKGVTEGGKVIFMLSSPAGDQNYPGNLHAEVTYSWSDDNELRIEYRAKSDADTVVNLTNHAYFNLSGENSGTVLDHTLKLHSSRWLPTDDTLIPTGELAPVEGTPMDFRSPKKLGKDIRNDFAALKYGKGYDNCWVADGWEKGKMSKMAELSDVASGRKLSVSSTQPGVQIYTGNWLAGSPESISGGRYADYDGVAIECQAFPDSPNKPQFPSVLLRANDEYSQAIVFKFSVDK